MGLNLDEAQRSVGERTGGRHAYDLQRASPTAAKLGDTVQLPRSKERRWQARTTEAG